jgi:hypothetical protein
MVECEFCHRSFSDAATLERHVRAEHAGRPFAPRCEICGETFESPADLKAHHEGVHHAGRA